VRGLALQEFADNGVEHCGQPDKRGTLAAANFQFVKWIAEK
jgi:hypothetical protein